MGTKALEEYVNGLPAGDYDAVNQSVRRGFQRNPDAYAKSLDLAKKTGVAPELQEGMEQDIDLEARAGQVPIQKIVQSHPALAKHLKDDGFATLAQNDLRSLMGLSAAVQAIPEMKPWNPTFADKTKDFFRGLMEGTTFATPEEAQAIRQAESARILTAAHMGVNPAEMHTGNAATLPASRIGAGLLRGALRPLSGAVRYAERKTGIDTGIGANLQGGVEALTPASPTTADTSVESFGSTLGLLVPSLGMQKAVGAISKVRALAKVPALIRQAGQWAGAVAMALPEAASEAQDVYDELKAKGSTDQEASSMSDRTFWGNAALLAVTDKIGWFSGEGLTRRVVAEAAQEGTQTGMSNAATGKPILENVPESALMGGATAGVMHVGGKFVSGLLGKQTTGSIDFSEKVQDTQEFLADLSEGVKASKIAETSPDRVQAFVQDAAKDGQENLLIPADRYFQTVTDAGLDPAELAQSLGVVNLQEAMEAGTDVVIPVGAYAAQIAATDLHGKLAQDIRLNPGDSTMREEQEAGKLAEDEAAKTTEDAQSIQVQAEIDALSTSSELDKYRESVKQAMIGGNIPADQAADLAETWIQPARVFIEQGDITAEQAAQMWPLTVTAYRKGEGKKSIAQIALDRLKGLGAGIKEYAQSVFHGSPYRFDKFSLEHLGKGEGAQAYGWGLYFAGQKGVAEYYRQVLTGESPANRIRVDGVPLVDALGGNNITSSEAGYLLEKYNYDPSAALMSEKFGAFSANSSAVRFALESLVGKKIERADLGQLYQVDIPDDGAYLLWDKPLSEQPEVVTKAIVDKLADSLPAKFVDGKYSFSLKDITGGELVKHMTRTMGDRKASMVMNQHGIAGIKYEDGSSRGKDGEKSFNYVVFDDNAVKVMKTFYQRVVGGKDGGMKTQTDTPEFKKWFGNSKAVGNDGSPLVVSGFYVKTDNMLRDSIFRGNYKKVYDYGFGLGKDAVVHSTLNENIDWYNLPSTVSEYLDGSWDGEASTAYYDALNAGFRDGKVGEKEYGASVARPVIAERIGKVGESKLSYNFRDQQGEPGLSVLGIYKDGKFEFQNDGTYAMFNSGERHIIHGFVSETRVGSDGEPMLLFPTDLGPKSKAIKNLKPALEHTFYQRGGGRYASSAEKRSARAKRAGQNTQASMDKAMTDAHNADEAEFAAFNAAVDEVQAGDILDDKRGFIQFGNQQIQIGLLEGRNLSTILHETSHAFLEMLADVAEMPTASERTKTLWADTLKELGITSRAEIETKHHEQFASWGERYFMEGKAPSEKMRPLMQRFQSWMQMVYKTLEKLGVRMNDDVRSVFDRLMATDAEIEAHKPTFETFATAEAMGVSQAEFDIYKKAQAGAIQEGHDRLQVEVMGDLLREQKAAYKAEKVAARAEVEAGVDSRPDMKAIAALTDPTNEIKLNRQAVQDQFGDARGLPVVEEGGMDAEAAAEMLGFDSGAQLYQALRDAPARADLIDTLTDEIMFARYGDVTLDGSIADKAVEALHNDKQADVLAMELRAMSRLKRIAEKVGKAKEGQDKAAQKAADVQIPGVSAFREQARNMVSGMTLRQMEPHKYELAELKYRKEADKLTKKKDYEGAVKAKTREMLNHFLYRAAKKGQEEAGKIYDYARSLEGNTAQGKLGKAGRVFQDQVNALLDRYQFSKETNKALDARQTLLEFVREQEANGEAVMIDPAILNEARRMNYREVPMSELRAVRDALKNIQTIAYRQLDMDIDGKHVAKDEAKAEMIASALLNFKAKPLPFSGSDLTVRESASKWLKGKSAMVTKMERVIDWLDGGKIDGPWRNYIFNRIAKAEIAEFDLNTAVTQKFIEAFEKMDPKHRLSMTDSVGVTLPGMDRPLNRRQAITLLLNMGNDQNQEKLLEGYGWTSPESIGMVGDALGHLTPGDLEFVNTTWKTINALWPAIEALEFKMTGLSPEKVDARPFTVTLKDGSQHLMDGGYFPIVYDPSRSPQGAKQIEGNVNELTDKGFSRPNTPHGFTKSRVQFSAPILLNFEHTLTRHLSQVIKDVTHREAVTDIYSLITSQDIRDTLNETIGEAQQKQFLPWLKSVVNDRNGAGTQGLEEFSGGIMAVRSNLITATLAFRLSSVIVQATDLVRAMDRVKPRFMAEAFASFTAAQRIGHNELVDEMREKSGEMRHRPQSFDRDMRVVLQRGFGDEPIKKRVAEFGAHGLSYADAITSTITWVGAYRQALAAGSSETEAIAEADRTVRLVLQSGSPKDLTPIQKGGALEKLLTMYAGDSFATYGIMQDAAQQIKGAKDAPKWAARMLFAVLMPAIIADLIKGRMPDDDEDKAKWLAWKAATALPNTLPILRDVSSSLESGYDYKFTPVAEAIAKGGRALRSAEKMVQGEKDPVDVLFQGIDAAGTLWGVPGTSQAMQTSKYLYKVSQGEENPDNAAQLVKNAILGKPKK